MISDFHRTIIKIITENINVLKRVCRNIFSGNFLTLGNNGFLNDVSITFTDKRDPSDALKWEGYWNRILKTMAPFGINIEGSVWSVIMIIDDSVIIYIYPAFRSRCCFGLLYGLTFLDNGYIYTIFIVITLRWMKVFQSDFLVGGVDFRWWKFPQIFGRITQATPATLCLQKIFAWPNWMEKLLSCTLFVYLFTYLFIYLLFIYLYVYFLFTLRELFIRSCIKSVVEYHWEELFQ